MAQMEQVDQKWRLWRGKYNCSGGWQFNLKAVINGFRETIAYKES